MTGLVAAIEALDRALDSPRRHHLWRWLVRNRLFGVTEALTAERARSADGWLAAREGTMAREREGLLRRVGQQVTALDAADLERLRSELKRLVVDLRHHHQRVNDLVYDTVSLEIGGSE